MAIDRHIAEAAVRLLNELLALDHAAVAALIAQRVPCNAALADHATVQVGAYDHANALPPAITAELQENARDFGSGLISDDERRGLDDFARQRAAGERRFNVGLLGILNGLCGTIGHGERQGWGPIVAIFEDVGGPSYQRLDRFELVEG